MNPTESLTRLMRWTDRRPVRLTLAAILTVASALLLFGVPGVQSFIPYRIDLDVYRIGASTLLSGADLYGPLPATDVGISLPFTYPPIAAALFVPLALMPSWLANLTLTAATLAAMWCVIRLVLRENLGPKAGIGVALLAMVLTLALGPVRETIGYGQINALLMALVVVDVLAGRNRPWRGCLVGIAIAIKLTPAVFLAYFLMRRDWRALAVALASAATATALGFLFSPAASVQYWTSTILDPSRIGGLAYVSNQSINGALVRLTSGGDVTLAWFGICAVIGLVSLWAMRRQSAVGLDDSAMVMMGMYALLASPVTWSHHWVWVAPALIVLVGRWRDTQGLRFLILAAVGYLVHVSRVVWLMPHEADREYLWSWWQHIVGNAQLLWGMACMIALATGIRRRVVANEYGAAIPLTTEGTRR